LWHQILALFDEEGIVDDPHHSIPN
jgi:hypothetical protein